MMDKLKTRWGVKNNFEVFMILLAFTLAGSSITFVRQPIFDTLHIDSAATPYWLLIPVYIIIIMPTYQVFLMIYGTIVGQFKFFWNFEKKMLRRFGLRLK